MDRLGSRFIARGKRGLPPEAVAAAVRTALTARRPATRYVVIRDRLTSWTIPRLLPPRLLDRIAARMLGLRRK
jgi:hypothetical protein